MSILDHIVVNVTDLARSKAFYEKALAPLGVSVVAEYASGCGFGRDKNDEFWISARVASYQKKEQLEPITPMHVCFAARSRTEVDAFYEAAMAAGGRDNGRPGVRKEYHPNYYGAFVLDPDGHNVEAVVHS